MMLSLVVSMIWLLAMMAATAHAQQSAPRIASLLQAGLAFAVVLACALLVSPQPNWVGVLVGLTAMWQLIGGPIPRFSAALSGACAALGAALQVGAGLPLWFAAPLGAGALFVALLVFWRVRARAGPHDLVLIVTALATPAIGLAGDLAYGWHSAAVLNLDLAQKTDVHIPGWAIAVVILALLAGAFKGIWKRK
jgi:hypothetical protein